MHRVGPGPGALVQLSENLLRVFREGTGCENGCEEDGRAASGTICAAPAPTTRKKREFVSGSNRIDGASTEKDFGAERDWRRKNV